LKEAGSNVSSRAITDLDGRSSTLSGQTGI